jgi:transcription elongation factor GreB
VSKAFTRESDEPGPDEAPALQPQLPPGVTNYITREGAERLRERLNELLERKRNPAALEAERQKLDSNIRRLRRVLDSVTVADRPVDPEKVAFGATVSVRHGDGEEEVYQLVGVEEADPARGRISWISPLARALLSRRAGETVTFRSPGGTQELSILRVSY